jgi:NAD kinase
MKRIVVVTKLTRYEELIREHLTEGAARFALESQGQSIKPYEREHAAYLLSYEAIQNVLPPDIPVVYTTRDNLPNFLFREEDVVIVCGPDGLFVNVCQYITDQIIVTVNPDPQTVSGVLMLFTVSELKDILTQIKEGNHKVERLPLIKAAIDHHRVIWGVNDVFIGRCDQISARYELQIGGKKESQSSSGIIISTGIGSTGWLRSIITMIHGIMGRAAQSSHQLTTMPSPTDNQLVFVVREPFPSANTSCSIVTGKITPHIPLVVVSEMPKGGSIFSDGVTERPMEFNAGDTVTISVGNRYVQRVVK